MPYIIRTRMVAAPLSTPDSLASLDPSRLADLLTSPTLSLPEIAAELGIPFSDLFTFLTSPEGEAFTHPLITLHTQRARLAATALIPKVITTLKHTLDHYDTLVKVGTATDRHHDHARKSCTLLLGLSSRSVGFQPTPRPPTPPSPAHLSTSSPVHLPPRPSATSAFNPAFPSPSSSPPRSSASSAYGSIPPSSSAPSPFLRDPPSFSRSPP